MLVLEYNNYKIYINNTSYACGDLLILKYVTKRGKCITYEYYTYQYIDHVIGTNGLLYMLCSSHGSGSDHRLLIIDGCYNRTTDIKVDGGYIIYEDNRSSSIIVYGNKIYCISGKNLVYTRFNREY